MNDNSGQAQPLVNQPPQINQSQDVVVANSTSQTEASSHKPTGEMGGVIISAEPPEPKKGSNWLLYVVIVLALIVILAGGYYYISSTNNQSQNPTNNTGNLGGSVELYLPTYMVGGFTQKSGVEVMKVDPNNPSYSLYYLDDEGLLISFTQYKNPSDELKLNCQQLNNDKMLEYREFVPANANVGCVIVMERESVKSQIYNWQTNESRFLLSVPYGTSDAEAIKIANSVVLQKVR